MNRSKDTQINLASSAANTAFDIFGTVHNPIKAELESKSIAIPEKDLIQFSIEDSLTKQELREWKRMPQSKKDRVIKKFERSSSYKKLQSTEEKYKQEQEDKEKAENKNKSSNSNNSSNVSNDSQTNQSASMSETANQGAEKSAEGAGEAASKATETAGEAASKGVEAGASAGAAASTSGVSEVVKVAIKAEKKMIQNIKDAVSSSSNKKDAAMDEEVQGTAKQNGVMQTIVAVLALAVTFMVNAIGLLILPLIVIIVAVVVVVVVVVTIISAIASLIQSGVQTITGAIVGMFSPNVVNYAAEVSQSAEANSVSEYVGVILAIMEVESAGEGNDVMQASESMGLAPNSLTPSDSIKQGVHYFSNLITMANNKGCDLDTAIQAYNYGPGFIDYVADRGKKYTYELAEEYAKEKSGGKTVEYKNQIAIDKNGGWRYDYGNMFYVQLIKQYLYSYDNPKVQAIVDEAMKYYGTAYVWGGSNPDTGFDCSGLTSWCFSTVDITIPRTAAGQYEATTRIEKIEDAVAGDLVFFTKTDELQSDGITHVALYLRDGKVFEAGDPLGIWSVYDEWHQEHYVGCGRVEELFKNE